MKHIHILPTDQPSRLVKNNEGKLKLTTQTLPFDNIIGCYPQSIYITSDEVIKEGDWCTDGSYLIQATTKLVGAQGLFDRRDWKKVILTTNPTLIRDGVQCIDDEFLEWFVKNPTCEFVEIDKIPDLQSYNEKTHKCELVYTIIMPQEEPKQESYICPHTKIQCDDECCVSAEDCHITSSLASGIEEPKQEREEEYFKHLEKDKKEFAKEWDEIRQEFGFDKKEETLEEAAENYAIRSFDSSWKDVTDHFIAGANYMSRRRYTEDEVRDLIIKALTHNDHDLCGSLVTQDNEIRTANFGVWFEHNKKDL
jgi:hypothetical protein